MSNHLKDCREESGLSQDEVAKLLKITRQALSNWETGKNEPDAKTLAALAKIYGKSIDELIHGKVEEQTEEQTEEAPEDQTEEAPEDQTEDVPEELMAEVPEDAQPIESFEVVPEMPTTTQKKSLSVKTRALLLALTVLLMLAVGFAAGWYACDYARSHKVYEEQVDLSKPYDTLEFFPLEDN